MAEMNDFGDIKESFDYITEAIDSMRAQNAMNAGNTDKILANINSRLEALANEESADLMKVFLTELKRSLEERHNFVSAKFSEIENSFKEIIEKTQNQLQAHEIRELFEIIASNLNVFSSDFSSQRDLISKIGLQIEELKQDDSQAREILKNISTLKIELEKVSNGFESVVLNLNSNFKELSQTLVKLDTSEEVAAVKKDIENVFLSVNAILSTLQVIDRKNRELEEVINHVVTKEDFNVEREQVAKLITQNIQLTDYISTLPTQNNFENLTEKIDTSIGVINALKNMLTETGKQNQQMLTAQLDNLEAKILNISSEDEFIGFRKELNDFAQEIIQSTNLMRTDIADTNADLKDLLTFLGSMDIKNSFMNFASLNKESENNIIENASKLSDNISKEIERNRKLTKVDIDGGLSGVHEKIDSTKQEITENSKSNMASILEHIQAVINNIFSVKNALHIDNLESVEAIDAKFQDLKEEITTSNNFIVQNAHDNMENVVSNVDKVSQEVFSVKEDINEKISLNSKKLAGSFTEISIKIEEIKNELNQSSQENFANLLSIVEDFSQEVSTLKGALDISSKENVEETREFVESLSEKINFLQDSLLRNAGNNAEEIKNSIETLSVKLSVLKEHLSKDSEANFSEVRSRIENLAQNISSIQTGWEQSSGIWLSGLKTNIEELSQEFNAFQGNFDVKSQSNFSKMVALFEDLSKDFNVNKQFLSESAQANFESVSLCIQNLNQKIEEIKENFNEDLRSDFAQIHNSIALLPETIKRNQSVFDSENKVLIEENSQNIIDVGDKVQNLIEGLIAKESPFKNQVLNKFSELKSSLEAVTENLSNSNQTLEEKVEEEINTNIQNLEKSIVEYSEKYNFALEELQKNLTGSFDLVQQTAQKNGLKLDNSIRETSEIKEEIQSVIDKISTLRSDSSFADLSAEINKKFEGILLNVTQLEEIASTKNKESIQNILNILEEKIESVSDNLKTYQNLTTEEVSEIVEELGDKVETIKSQISFVGTDIINALSAKTNEVITWLSPINQAVNKISEINFEEMVIDIKNKIDNSYFSITSVIKEDMKKENSEQLQKISHDFESLNNKLNDNEFLIEQFASVKDLISNARVQNTESIEEALEIILEKLETITVYSTSGGSSDFSKAEEIIGRLEDVEGNLSQSQNEIKEAILERLHDNYLALKDNYQTSTKSVVSEIVENSVESSRERVFAKLDALQDRMLETQDNTKETILDELKANVEAIKESLSFPDITGINEELKEEISQKIEKLQESLQLVSEGLEGKFSESEANYRNSAQSLLSEVKTSFYEKVDDSLDDLRSFLEVLQSKKDFSEEFDNIKSEVFDKFSELTTNFENNKKDVSEEIENVKMEIFGKFSESIENSENDTKNISLQISNVKKEVFDKFSEFGENIEVNKEGFSGKIENLKTEVLDKISEVSGNLETNKEGLSGKIENLKTSVFEKFSAFGENFKSDKKEFFDEIENLKSEVLDRISEISGNLEVENLKAEFSDRFSEISENLGENKEEFSSEIENLKTEISDMFSKVTENLGENKENFSSEIESLKNEILDKFSEFSENLESDKKELSTGLDTIKKEIFDRFSESIENAGKNKKSISTELDTIKTEIFDKFSESIENSEQNKKSISLAIDNIKTDIFAKFSEIADNLETSILSTNIKEDLDSLNTEIETSVNDLLDNLYEKLLLALEDNKVTNDIFDKTEEVSRRIEDLKDTFTEDVAEKISAFEIGLEQQTKDFSELVGEVKTSLAELKESYIDLNLNSTMEVSGALITIQEKIETLENKIDEIDLSEQIQSIESKIESPDFSKLIDDFEDKLGNLDFSQIANDVENKLNEFDFDAAIENSKNEIIDKFSEFNLDEKIESIEIKVEDYKNELTDKFSEFDLDGKVENIEDKIENSKKEITSELELIKKKLDSLTVGSDSQMEENVEEIKQMIDSQGNLLNKLDKLEEIEKIKSEY